MKIINSFKILALLGLFFTTSFTVLAQVPTTGLLAHYKFESSGTCADETGNYNATSVSGPVLNTQGMIGNCYEFDGTNDKVDLPAIAIGNNTGTICGWFKKDAGSGTSRKVIGRFWQQHAFGVEGSGNYEGLWNDNWLGSSSVYDDSQWHFFALIYDGSLGSQNIKLWIDDYILTTSNATGNNINESSIWQIGTHGNNDHYWDGLIDEVRLYNRALTTTEIEALYDEPNSSNPTALDGGSISIADTIVNYGSQPPMITSSVDPSGGDCSESYTYDWQSSVGSANFVSLSVNSSTYQPAALTQSTTFRRVVYCGSDSAYSNNVINITVIQSTGSDSSAFHSDISQEIENLNEKTNPIGTDILLIEDSQDSYSKKKVQLDSLPARAINLEYLSSDTSGVINPGSGNSAVIPSGSTTIASLMLPEDKTKLDGIAENANNYTLPEATSSVLGGVIVDNTTITVNASGVITAVAASGEDVNAIHTNEPAEINTLSTKAVPENSDVLVIEDSSDSYNKKKVLLSTLPGGTGTDDQNATEVLLTSYSMPASGGSIGSSDDVQTAIGKLEKGLESATAGGGEDNVQADWNEGDTGSDAYILNKPTIPGYQSIDVFSLAGTVLSLSLENDSEPTKTINLSAIQDGTGTDDQNATEVLLSSYSLPASGGSISSSDDVQTAIGKLEKGLESATAGGGEDNVQADWNEGDTGSDAYILNKPTIPGYQTIDEFSLDGTVLSLSLENDSEATKTINLSAIQDGTGTDNQTIDYFSLDGTTLSLSLENDGESTKTVDLSGLEGSGSVWTDNSTYINYSGKVGINTTRDPGTYHLEVNGSIHAKEVVIDVTNWADYVFGNNYNLKPLNEVESFIKENKHLPEIPSAKEVEEEGIDLGEMNMLLLKKVEELTLYLLQQEKRIKELEEKIN